MKGTIETRYPVGHPQYLKGATVVISAPDEGADVTVTTTPDEGDTTTDTYTASAWAAMQE